MNIRGKSIREEKNENCPIGEQYVRWKNVSLFSAVNSPGQQTWLLVGFFYSLSKSITHAIRCHGQVGEVLHAAVNE